MVVLGVRYVLWNRRLGVTAMPYYWLECREEKEKQGRGVEAQGRWSRWICMDADDGGGEKTDTGSSRRPGVGGSACKI